MNTHRFDQIRSTFDGRSVLVTGHTGFKGAWLSAWLSRWGAEVTGLSLAPDEEQQPLFSLVSEMVEFSADVMGDVRDLGTVDRVFAEAKPDIVFHLAAQPLVRRSYDEPVLTFATNVMGTANVLEAVRRHRTPTVVCVTTDKCYENVETLRPYRETDPMGGWDPYSASKGAAELLIASYARSYFGPPSGTACASARAGNVVGGGDLSRDRLVPDLFRAMVNTEPVTLRRPAAVRPWQHVLESLSGYLTLAAALDSGRHDFAGGWNFGPDAGERVTVAEFVDEMLAALGAAAPAVRVEADGPHEAGLLTLDIAKARDLLGWEPILTIPERARLTADWFDAARAGEVGRDVVDRHFDTFEERWEAR